jgi:single-stranded-DNA-specific exonuclease
VPEILERAFAPETSAALQAAGVEPVLARIYAGRGVTSQAELDFALGHLLPPGTMRNLGQAACLLADAIEGARRLLIVADYDCDGATACAVGVLGLRAMGAQVDFLVPNRFEYGYGLTPEIVHLARQRQPDLLITVDNGISSLDGVAEASRLGMQVLVTDHHLPGPELPAAACIVNPNQPGCAFPSKSLAGVGVMYYTILQLRGELRRRGAFAGRDEPNLGALLDLVALGTVADVVRLDRNNRVLVEQGLRRIRSGRCRPGIAALLQAGGRTLARAGAHDLGFVVGPRINAAGRLTDMSLGIECLLAEDAGRAADLARQLDALNRERRSIEADMQASALALLDDAIDPGSAWGLALYEASWHQGVIGILAARLRERFHRPVIAFADGAPGELKGSGRSIPSLHLRDALDLVSKRHPGLLLRFGGHAAAAGLSIRSEHLERFRAAFDATLSGLLTPADLEQRIETDGSLRAREVTLQLAEAIGAVAWGQGFPAPRFHGDFDVGDQRVLGGGHLKLRLCFPDGTRAGAVEAILFGRAALLPDRIRAVYRLEANEWNGLRSVQMVIEHWESAAPAPAAAAEAPSLRPLSLR